VITSIFKLLGSIFTIWEHKQKNKYKEKFMKLERQYYEETKKDQPSDAVLDNIEFELHLLATCVDSEIKGSKT
jgi:hypothetical protein